MKRLIRLCAISVGLWLLWGQPVLAQEIVGPGSAHPNRLSSVFTDLSQANVVYLGETHDNEADHLAQLQIIQELHHRNPHLAIGMEMFQRPFQSAIDAYLRGEITEDELRQQSEYDRRWGFPWENYAPILRFAKANQIPILALNTPTEVTRRAARKGLALLSVSDRQWIPPISEIQLGSDAYRQFLRPLYDSFHDDVGSSDTFDSFFLAQVLWDETMADRVVTFLRANPEDRVIVLAGQGHVMYGYGIPSRVAHRMQNVPHFKQRLVLLNPSDDVQNSREEGAIADYFWISPAN
ncbi:MAG TPA: ChaN family lipoprotein [Crinalium sp.]